MAFGEMDGVTEIHDLAQENPAGGLTDSHSYLLRVQGAEEKMVAWIIRKEHSGLVMSSRLAQRSPDHRCRRR